MLLLLWHREDSRGGKSHKELEFTLLLAIQLQSIDSHIYIYFVLTCMHVSLCLCSQRWT